MAEYLASIFGTEKDKVSLEESASNLELWVALK